MATADTYCTHKEFKRVFPQLDSFDNKKAVYGWKEVTTNKYAAHNSGIVSQLFADGEDLGPSQSAHTDLNVEGEWFYNSAEDVLYYYSATNPNDKLMEAGEEFTAMVTQFRADASRYLDSMLDPNMPREAFKDKSGNYDYLIIRTTALIAANFMIKAHDPNSELANALLEEAMLNIQNLNEGKAALSWQTTRDSSNGIIRDVTYTDGSIRPVDTRGDWRGTYDLIKVKITTAGGVLGTAKYSVWLKDSSALKNNKVITDEIVTGDYQSLANGLQIRFAGATDASEATLNNEWEIEVFGAYEDTDASSGRSVKMTRTKRHGIRY